MTIWAGIAAALGLISMIFGAISGHRLGKLQGKKEGVKQAENEQKVQQAQSAINAIEDRKNVEQGVSADSDAELDRRLSKHDRSG